MKFEEKYKDSIGETDSGSIIYLKTSGQCEWCGDETNYADVDFQRFACSEECNEFMTRDYMLYDYLGKKPYQKNNNKLIVYLAGGMRSNWREKFNQFWLTENFEFINPQNNGTKDLQELAFWDIMGVKQSDIIFAYLEESNPSGYGTMVEAGYALGQNKNVIFVNEKMHTNKYTTFLQACPNVISFDNFGEGFRYFSSLGRLKINERRV